MCVHVSVCDTETVSTCMCMHVKSIVRYAKTIFRQLGQATDTHKHTEVDLYTKVHYWELRN